VVGKIDESGSLIRHEEGIEIDIEEEFKVKQEEVTKVETWKEKKARMKLEE
jgi:hypothetical protein